ncbi:hypothetical protein RFI_20506 [Reticulomyxa filosa]|uniref:CNNM transmembrane domain-containing protein n=1 Tax=Reticulomyxa filosa TaxID=46433 RepID=X6MS79_RETFI|nr:hypothetical protein RFI_20506 [Reticulomyxa filosa]|eukprot:ETO16833.1 hypothetical protein RFI_20506 [Reticulomyxa filosa]
MNTPRYYFTSDSEPRKKPSSKKKTMSVKLIAEQVLSLTLLSFSDGSVQYVDKNGHFFRNLSDSTYETGGSLGLETASVSASTHFLRWTQALTRSMIKPGLKWDEMLLFCCICVGLVTLGGITSGLNVSLLAIDPLKIRLMETSNVPYNQKMVKTVKPLIENQHFLLVTLLVANATGLYTHIKMNTYIYIYMYSFYSFLFLSLPLWDQSKDKKKKKVRFSVSKGTKTKEKEGGGGTKKKKKKAMEALPIFLDEMVASWLSVIISVSFVLVFGEILPQAFFAHDPMKAGYRFACVVRVLQFLFFPICYPLAWLLDRLLPHKHGWCFRTLKCKRCSNSFHKTQCMPRRDSNSTQMSCASSTAL